MAAGNHTYQHVDKEERQAWPKEIQTYSLKRKRTLGNLILDQKVVLKRLKKDPVQNGGRASLQVRPCYAELLTCKKKRPKKFYFSKRCQPMKAAMIVIQGCEDLLQVGSQI